MSDFLRIIQDELFIACPFLKIDAFIKYCKERGVRISKKDLELFEREKLFSPIARVEHPKIKEKFQYVDGGKKIQSFGILEENEKWDGELKEIYGQFWFGKRIAQDFYRERLLWSPADRPFTPWETFYDKDLMTARVDSYYSPFQIYHLHRLISLTHIRISTLWWSTFDEKGIKDRTEEIITWANEAKKNPHL